MIRNRIANPLLRFRLPAVLLAFVIVFGVAGFMLIDGWNLLDAFYMVIITISTVGFSELHPQGTAGRLFTSGLIVVGVGTMLYGFGVFAETLAENAFGAYRRERQLQRSLNQLSDHFIICGYGRIGTQIVAEFEEHKVPYAVIDQTEEAVGRLRAEPSPHRGRRIKRGRFEARGHRAGTGAHFSCRLRRTRGLHRAGRSGVEP